MDAGLVTAIRAFPRQALHARFLTFQHPVDQREMRFEAALPQDMLDLLETLQEKAGK
jgi:23S rRNA pseudouridine1911/1915/1917 synthase